MAACGMTSFHPTNHGPRSEGEKGDKGEKGEGEKGDIHRCRDGMKKVTSTIVAE